MSETVGYDAWARMLQSAAAEIRANHEMLSKLDSVGGDGDHGTTMLRAMTRLDEAVRSCQNLDSQTLLNDVGWAILGVDGGAIGPLLGTWFMGMAEALGGADAGGAPAMAKVFHAGLAKLAAQTKARPGDKTIMDAFVPAVRALNEAADAGATVPEALDRAAAAAREGADGTAAMQARFGRAKNIKEQSVGSRDPGAESVSLLFQGFAKGIIRHA